VTGIWAGNIFCNESNIYSKTMKSLKRCFVTPGFAGMAIVLLTTISATSQVIIIGENSNGLSLSTPGATYGLGYDFGDTTSASVNFVSGAGTNGSGAFQVVNNAASGSDGYSGAGADISDGSVTGNTSQNLGDYTLSFWANANAGSLLVQLSSWSQSGFAGTQALLSTAPQPAGYGNDLTLNPGYTYYSLNLGNAAIWNGNTSFAPNDPSLQITFQLDGGGPTPYTDTLNIDGLSLVMNPEAAVTTNVLFETDYNNDAGEGNFYTYYGYTIAGSSDGPCAAGNTTAITYGAGVNGSNAVVSTADYTLLPDQSNWTDPTVSYVYAVLANGTQFSAPLTNITPTSVLSSFVLSADLQVLGLPPGLTNTDVTISKVQFQDISGNVLFEFYGDAGLVPTNNLVPIAVPLSELTYGSPPGNAAPLDPVTDLTNSMIVGSISNCTIEFAVEGLTGSIGGNPPIQPVFGFTNIGSLVVDDVALVQTISTLPPIPTQPQILGQANFNTTFPATSYGYHYRDGVDDATAILTTNVVGGSNSLDYAVNFSSWSGDPPSSYSGFGVGAGFSPLPDQLISSDQASYLFSFSAKCANLPAGTPSVSGVADLLFLTPSGVVYDLEPTITLTTNWQSFAFNGASCPIGVNNGGSQAMFNEDFSQVDAIQVEVTAQGSPDIGAVFDYGTNAIIDIANINVTQLVPGLPPVSVVNSNGRVEVVWTDPVTGGTAQLQSATSVTGPYINISGAASGAASPYLVPAGNRQQFFRTVWVP
jgi:hypothetical protein